MENHRLSILSPYVIGKGWMKPLEYPAYFRRVKLNDGGNLEWPDGQDFNPEALYGWPRLHQLYIEDMKRNHPFQSVSDFTRGSGWGLALGFGVEYETAYDGSDEYEFEIEPAGGLHYRIDDHLFFWEGIELGWRGLVGDQWLLQAGARYEDGLEPDDSDCFASRSGVL